MITNNLNNVIYLTQAQYDARLQANTLSTGIEYRIIDKLSKDDVDDTIEKTENKIDAINENNKTDANKYASAKAVADYVDSVLGQIETLLSEV